MNYKSHICGMKLAYFQIIPFLSIPIPNAMVAIMIFISLFNHLVWISVFSLDFFPAWKGATENLLSVNSWVSSSTCFRVPKKYKINENVVHTAVNYSWLIFVLLQKFNHILFEVRYNLILYTCNGWLIKSAYFTKYSISGRLNELMNIFGDLSFRVSMISFLTLLISKI